MAGATGDYPDEAEESDEVNAIPITSRRQWTSTALERFALGNNDVDGYQCEYGDDAVVDAEESAAQVDDGSLQNVEDCAHSTRECDEWTVYFRPVKYANEEANAIPSNVSNGKTALLEGHVCQRPAA